MTWQLVALLCWASLLAVGVWVLRWRMAHDAKVSALEAANAELHKQLKAATDAPVATLSTTMSRMSFLPGAR